MTAKHLRIFRHLFSLMIQNVCLKDKKTHPNSLPAVISQRQMFLFLPPVSSKFCSSIAGNVGLKASSCFSPIFVPPPSSTKDMDFSQNREARGTHELNEAKMGISLRIKRKKEELTWSTLMTLLQSSFLATKMF